MSLLSQPLLRRSIPFVGRLAWVAASVALAGCVESHACTEIGCSSQLSITLRTATGAWPDGAYQLTVRADGLPEGRCSFRLPEQLSPHPGQGLSVPCGTGIQFQLSPEVECQMGCNGTACWQECTPIPGKFAGQVTVDGTPGRVDLTLSRDGTSLLAEGAEPVYQDVYPNGPDCGPVCRQSKLEYTLP